MNIGGIGSNSFLLKKLEANGLSADKAKLVQTDLTAAEKTPSLAGAASAGISPSVRAAFDAKIAADVSSGKLSASDATTVKKTLDNLDGQAATATAQSSSGVSAPSQAGGPARTGGGGDGGGGASSKTELSETVTVSGSTMTTVITYTDGTTSTTTTTATDVDQAKYAKQPSADAASGVAGDYAPSIDKGSLVDQVA